MLGVLDELAAAFARHDDLPRPADAMTAVVRHAVEARTFAPRRGAGGVHLVDAVAARFGAFDHVHLVGLVETDWPERPRRSIFYTSGMLKVLGWPQEPDQARAQVVAVLARQANVHENHVRRGNAQRLDGLGAVVGDDRLVSANAQHQRHTVGAVGVIVDHEDEQRAGR